MSDTLAQATAKLAQQTVETATQNANIVSAINENAFILSAFGWQINLVTVMIIMLIVGVLVLFWKIQASEKLDFTDMFTSDGRKVSLTKFLQFLSGIASTWFIVKTGLQGTLSSEIFAIYLAYMASIEGFSKFVAAKYNYSETSVRDAQPTQPAISETVELIQQAVESSEDATKAAKEAEKSLK